MTNTQDYYNVFSAFVLEIFCNEFSFLMGKDLMENGRILRDWYDVTILVT